MPEIAILTPPAPDGDDGRRRAGRGAHRRRRARLQGAAAARRSPRPPTAPRRCARWRRSSGRAARGSSPPSGSSPTSSTPACPPARRSRSSSPTTASTAASPALDLLIEAEHGPDSSAYLVTASRKVAEDAMASLPGHWAAMTLPQRVEFSRDGADRAARRHRARAVDRGGATASSTTTRRSIWNSSRPSRSRISATSPMRPRCCWGRTRRSSIANFVLGPNGVLPTGGWARTYRPAVGDRLHEALVGRLRHLGGLSGAGAALEAPVGIRGLLVACQRGVGDPRQSCWRG